MRIATARYVLTGRANDVSDAVQCMVENDLRPHVPTECLHDLNVFRERFCYLEPVDQARARHAVRLPPHHPPAFHPTHLPPRVQVLRRHEASLRALYKAFAQDRDPHAIKDASSRDLASSSLMGCFPSASPPQ